MKITEIELNKEYLITKQSKDISYSDVFQLRTTSLKEVPKPKDCMVAFFKAFSPFFIKLLLSREKIAKNLGLKTATKRTQVEREAYLNEFEGNIGDSIALFDVLDKNDIELLTGQTDKHLDFKLSFISYEEGDDKIMELATTVKIHNTLGKIYFFLVKPFHRYFMKKIFMKMEKEVMLIEKRKRDNTVK
ncbi:hypothetical protein IWQ47_000413 [Aquimarina sp. EL_43]|uniref:DUF2867 domain-containing protein n=1 Tax=Aquimarina TaxID=290174 RepID=UPI000472FA16|nr:MULTISPECIES: DUF2867 domain-containing protein [Aquimarina]MBG6128894.1 hypothetical protein [Aquimarina sp. EL_35]MBG6149958.1 hypothetical protein [Aquimarina sp. EL_32]MBG6167355.1 hypothetical protein [Aquimarina sp. EL_43]